MSRNQVRTLWTVIVTAFLALCTALGLITATAAAAVTRNEPARNSDPEGAESPQVTIPTQSPWSHARALPPTMKQRIRAEAHGTSPHCRHHPLTDTASETATDTTSDASCDTLARGAEPALPLQR
ncbi:DUF6344 domain-containing protein [Streptomyces sp. MUM 2J]|uniref:DUF6344 domain-containing protein n=1 Tax=Streptomyces sp. MUM 2J TaxID=2791987 RepID=UPI001F037080|nr:DUF6344 domain-containing protein [Streptomyces sp. MUM 2J]MCH0564383.1 hypothetical protein [Streptomyces sp. MUM 2J]